MSELTDFLLERIGEDEEIARQALSATVNDRTDFALKMALRTAPLWTVTDASAFGKQLGARGSVEARPGRVLAECEAKRRIVELHLECGFGTGLCDDGGHGWNWEGGPGGCGTLGLLALPYSDHPDFREEWKP